MLTFTSFCRVWSQSLSRSLHRCKPSNPSTISPIEILSSDLLVELNEFGQYWRRCVERCDWIFQAILLTSTVRWAWIHDGYKSGWAPALAVGVFKKESILMIMFAPRRKIMGYESKKTSLLNFVVARNDEVGPNFVKIGPPNFVEKRKRSFELDAGRIRPKVTFWEIGLTKIIWNNIFCYEYVLLLS